MLPIIRVTLYTSGVGYFERGGELDRQETQIGTLTAEQAARQEELMAARTDLRRYFAGLSL